MPTNSFISLVVPVYKEEKNILPFLERAESALDKISSRYEILFCLDPSPDGTEEVIQKAIQRNPRIRLLVCSRRFGQPAATMAGLAFCRGDYILVIDVDLQDPPELLAPMYRKMQEGYDVVYARRRTREGETFIKKIVSAFGYKVINRLSDVRIPKNTGDFRLMSRRVVDEINKLHETHGFLRGLVAYVGFPQTFIEYDRDARLSGKGHYNRLFGSLKIGLNGLIGFSSRPLQLMSLLGALLAGLSFLLGAWYVFQHFMGINLTPGLSTTVLVVTFFSGVQLLCLGLMGEYIGRIYDEVKRRPAFIVDKKINLDETNDASKCQHARDAK
jgi:polyisoprenyl-phosphate glycosyltransferase